MPCRRSSIPCYPCTSPRSSTSQFSQGSLRKEFNEAYFTPEAQAWASSVRMTSGASVPTSPLRLPPACSGPLFIELRLPLTDAAVATASDACTAAAALWLGWLAEATTQDQRKTMTTFAYDTKVRALALSATADLLVRKFGATAAPLAAEDAGPVDRGDRGSAMNQAATTNFNDEEADATMRDMEALRIQKGDAWRPTN